MNYHGGMKGDHWALVSHPVGQAPPHMGVGGDILDWLLGYESTRFKQFLKAHGAEAVTSVKVGRSPIAPAVRLGFDILTAGKFEEAHKRLGVDNFFHLYLIINNRYRLEKNETVNEKDWSPSKGEEVLDVAGAINKTIDDMIQTASRGNEKAFWLEYNPLANNCQQWVTTMLSKNGILTPSATQWINQDMKALIEELPHGTQEKAKQITDIASVVNRIVQLTTGGRLGFAVGGEDLGEGREILRRPKAKRRVKGLGKM